MRNDVFIAYSRKDTYAAELIESHLQKSGLRCYRDVKSIPGSEQWMNEISQSIDTCHAVLVIVSENSVESHHVSRELAIAVESHKPFVPILLSKDVKISHGMRYSLAGHQQIIVLSSLDAVLPLISDAVWRAVDQSRHKNAYNDIASMQKQGYCNYQREINFAEDRCGLYVGDASTGIATINDGAYVLAAKPNDYLGFEMSALPRMTEYILEVLIRKIEGPDDSWFGFEFGERYPGNYYQFLINGQGSVHISKHLKKQWHDLGCHHNLRHVKHGNAENILKVVRKGTTIHIFVNGLHALSANDWDVRIGRFSPVVGHGIRAAFTNLSVKGVELAAMFAMAIDHWNKLEILKAKQLLKDILKYDPLYRHPGWDVDVNLLLWEIRPDREKTILIVVGYKILPQLNDGIAAAKLRDYINQMGNRENMEFACVVTDTGLIEDRTLMQCPLVALGGPVSNKITAEIAEQLPQDPISTEWIKVQHEMGKNGKQVALWGGNGRETANAVDIFISSGLLDRFLKMVWGQKSSGKESTI